MVAYEDDIVILLRKIVALSIPSYFEATEDLFREILLDKLKLQKKDLFQVCNDFIIAIDSMGIIRNDFMLKTDDEKKWIDKNNELNIELSDCTKSLIIECKKNHITIDYELNKLLN
ncbi:MAG: hypothetical protein KAG84_05455 [Bacteroidales bacterium]|nr:hypothetical protein [Bacteroidales bacterium]